MQKVNIVNIYGKKIKKERFVVMRSVNLGVEETGMDSTSYVYGRRNP